MDDPLLGGCLFRSQMPQYFLSSLCLAPMIYEPTVITVLFVNPSTKFLLLNQNIVERIVKVLKSLANFNSH